MSFTTDLFISYNDDIHVKQEKSSDHHSPLDSSSTYESSSSYFNSVPQAIQNLLNSDDQAFTIDPYFTPLNSDMRRKSKPFIIIKSKKSPSRKSSLENFEVKIESEERLATRTKRIIKREKAKLRLKVKQEPDCVSTETTSKIISDSLSNFEGDGKTKKKMVQMIRNRISAQNSRDRKKAYLMTLEDNKCKLREENTKLNEENSQLLKELQQLEKAQQMLKQENEALKQNKNKTGANCIERDENMLSEDNENNFSEHSLSSLLNSLNRPDLNNFTLVNVKQNKRTMGLATLISLLVVMNLVQSGNIIIQGENENDRNLDISGIQKKILQEASQAVENLQKEQKDLSSFSGWDLIQYLEPIIKRFGSGYHKNHSEAGGLKDQEDPCIPRNLIKVEDFADNDMNENNKFIKALFSDKINLMEEDDLITTEEGLDKKSQTSTFFCADSFECCTNERKDEIDEEQGYHKFFGQNASKWNDDYKIGDIEYN